MLLPNISHKNYTKSEDYYQLKIPFELDAVIPEDDSVRLLSQFIEGMDLSELYATYSRIRKGSAAPRRLLKVTIYGRMNRQYSCRDVETSCKRDINFMYLLEGDPAPDHATLARFQSLHLAPCIENIMAQMTEGLYELGEISGENIFIDGTKIEACSNKYTFVWKKAVTKNLQKLLQKMADFVAECEEKYGISIVHGDKVKMYHLKKLKKKLYQLKKEKQIEFVQGKGKRKHPLQRSIEQLKEYQNKLQEYTQKLYVCGTRNSYSKTDHDATFMRMKEDAMKNGQLKPGYNLQHGVDSEYIVWLTVGSQPTDTTTLIPFLKELEERLSFKYKNIVADAGYESEENYMYLEENGQLAFIKPSNYEISKKRKYKTDIGRKENMDYDKEQDFYTCKNGKKLVLAKTKRETTKTGYKSEKSIYTCEDCSECPYKIACIKGNNSHTPIEERTKSLQVAKQFQTKREECLERITTEEGIRLRMNRSIQAEGSFGEIKGDMGFRRYLSRGKRNVLTESMIIAMAHNIKKLHSKIQNENTGKHLFQVKEA